MISFVACAHPDPVVPFDDLVAEMLDRDAIARLPDYGAAGISTTDPSGGDDDRGHYVRDERHGGRTEHVLVDAEGPGVLVRLWSANPERGGTLRIRLDGAEEPWLEADFAELMSGRGPVPAPLAATKGRGSVLLLPIPFQDRLLVTIDKSTGRGLYAAAQWRTLPRGTRTAEASQTLDTLVDGLASVEVSGDLHEGTHALSVAGPGAVRALRFAVPPDAIDAIGVTIDVDGVRTVDVPLSGLTGLGPHATDVHTWWVTATPDGHIELRWPIPFRRSLQIALTGGVADSRVAAIVGPWTFDARTLTLHGATKTQSVQTRPRSEVSFAELTGPGVFVADTLRIDNPTDGWWGMGDERLIVDGALAWTGTGTEDWYGAAWCSHAPFSSLLAAQAWSEAPETEDACAHARGGAVYTRGRILDAIPFPRSLDLRFEVAHREETTLRMAMTTLWYAELPGGL